MERDVVLFTAAHEIRYPELSFALRSLSMVPHGTVWLIGCKPPWVNNVEHVRFREGEKWQDLTDKWHTLRTLPLSDEFIYTEDDYYILKPVDDIPNYTYPKPLKARCGAGEYGTTHKNTYRILKRYLDRIDMASFDVHIPMVVERDLIPYHLDPGGIPLRYRTLIGNTSSRPAVPLEADVKHGDSSLGFLSSTPISFPSIEPVLSRLFPDPCEYEE